MQDRGTLVKDFEKIKDFFVNFDEEDTSALDTILNKFSTRLDTQFSRDIEEYNEFFQTDDAFVRMRVAGQNPVMLTLVKDINVAFPLSNEIFNSINGFENDSLLEAQKEKRLYIID